MRKAAIASALALAALPSHSATGSAQNGPKIPSYCQGYQPEMISLDGTPGGYMRVSPDGNYAIISFTGASILDLTGKDSNGNRVAKLIGTSMKNEAYPVEGNWNYIASPGFPMSFYRFKDLLKKGVDAMPEQIVDRRPNSQSQNSVPSSEPFTDNEHWVEYYHSAAELPGGDQSHATYRVSLFEDNTSRDYDVWFNPDGSAAKVEKKPIKPLCQNIIKSGQSFADSHVSQPILSKDGTEMAGLWHNTTHIFKIKDDGTCEVEDDLGILTYKVSFSYPESGKRSKIVFTDAMIGPTPIDANGTVTPSELFNGFRTYVYDPNNKKMTPLLLDPSKGTPSYPGWTKDGRIYTQVNTMDGPFIAVFNPKKLIPLPDLTKVPDNKLAKKCFQDAETYAQAVASLGEVWNSICQHYPSTAGSIFISDLQQMRALSMDSGVCVKMVHENYQNWKNQHPSSTLTESHLAVACKAGR